MNGFILESTCCISLYYKLQWLRVLASSLAVFTCSHRPDNFPFCISSPFNAVLLSPHPFWVYSLLSVCLRALFTVGPTVDVQHLNLRSYSTTPACSYCLLSWPPQPPFSPRSPFMAFYSLCFSTVQVSMLTQLRDLSFNIR